VRWLFALAALVAVLLLPTAAAGAGTVPVPPGTDASYDAAYNSASAGDVLELTNGRYGEWDMPSGSKQITVRAGLGTRPIFKRLHVYADNVTFDGVHVDAEGTKTAPGSPFETHGRHDITFKNGSIGNNIDQMAVLVGGDTASTPLNITFDNVDFHDAVMTPQGEAGGVHMECVYSQAPGLTIRNSRFRNCSVMDLFITRGTWWGQQRYDGITLVGNTFDTPRRVNGACCHFYSVGINDVSDGNFEQFVARNNTTEVVEVAPGDRRGVWSAGSQTFNGSAESCNTPPSGFRGITVEACNPDPTPTPEPTPEPTPDPAPEPTPTPEPYEPACKPDCDETITALRDEVTALKAKIAAAQTALN
jgi:hypothetical protein